MTYAVYIRDNWCDNIYALFGSTSFATINPFVTISNNWHVFDPGAAHISKTKSVG